MRRRSLAVPVTAALALALLLCSCGGDGSDEPEGRDGAAGAGDPYFPQAGNGGFDVGHYGLALDWAPKGNHLTGTAVITARATEDLRSFHLDLRGMHVDAVDVDGKGSGYSRAGDELVVRPADVVRDGKRFTATVRYSGSPVTIKDADGTSEGWVRTKDGAVALGEPIGGVAWFPGSHHPGDKAALDVDVTVPKGLTAMSNGELRGTRTHDGKTTFRWHSAEPVASDVTTVAIGRYRTKSYAIGLGEQGGGRRIPVWTAVEESQGKKGEDSLKRLPEIMRWENRTFGPYPFSSTGAIVERPHVADYALETQTRPFYPGAPDDLLLVHELAHQWYGDSVSPKDWRGMWLNEGFATYAEWLWQEEHGGDTAQKSFDAVYDGSYFQGSEDDPSQNPWAFPPSRPSGPAHLSDSPVYEGGAMVLHKIRQTVGDATFRRILTGWAAAHRHGNADSADFTRYVESVAGKDARPALEKVWAQWLYGKGKPKHP